MKSGKRFPIILLALGLAVLSPPPVAASLPGSISKSHAVAGARADGRHATASAAPQAQLHLPITGTTPDLRPQTSPASQNIQFERISIADGLSQSVVTSIYQDRQGFMWFGTQGGLNRYDGYQFTIYKHHPDDPRTLSDNQVSSILEDQQGELWIGTNRGLDWLDRATGAFTHFQHDPGDAKTLSAGAVLAIYQDRAGTLWVGTTSGLNRLDRSTQTFTHYQHKPGDAKTLSNNAVWVIYQDRSGELWIGTNGGLDRLDRETGSFTHYQHNPDDRTSLSDNRVRAIFEDRLGVLWIGTDGGGLDQRDGSSQTFVHFPFDASTSSTPPAEDREETERNPDRSSGTGNDSGDNRVTAILEDNEGRLWVGTQSGLEMLDRSQNRFLHYRHVPSDPHSLSDDGVHALYEDRSGVLWIGTHGGLSKYNRTGNRFKLYQQGGDVPNGLSDNLVLAIHEDRSGALWVGTFAGGLNRLDRDAEGFTVYQHSADDPASLGSNDVRAIYEDREGVLWVGTDLGLDQFDAQSETFIRNPDIAGNRVNVIAEHASGDLWVGTSAGLFRLVRTTGVLEAFHSDSVSGSYVSAISEDQAGTLWVGTYGGGISLWDDANSRFTHYRHKRDDGRSLSNDLVLSIYQDTASGEGAVWIGTEEGGLNRFDPSTQTFTHFTKKDGLPGDTVACILGDSNGYLWLGTNKGLSRFDPQTETFRNYDAQDGVLSGEFSLGACFQSEGGEMFFGGFQGFNAFYPAQIKPNQHPPPIVITAFDKFNQTVRTGLSANEHLRLSYLDDFVSFEFAALDYTAPAKNQYAYMMEGLDRDWVYAGTQRRADYRNLGPGDYVFRAKGSNNDGVWNEEGIAINIIVAPAFWETWWFRAMALVVLLGSVIGGYRLRVRSLEARSHELERQVEERTYEIEQRRQVAEGLGHIVAVLNSNRPLGEVLDYIVIQASRLLGSGGTVLHHIEHDRRFVAIEARFGLPDELTAVAGFPLYASIMDEAILNRRHFIMRDMQDLQTAGTDDAGDDPAAKRWFEVTGQHYRSFLAVPLIVADQVYGWIAFYYPQPKPFPQEEIGLAAAFADQAALAIENARLRTQAEEAAVTAERNRLARDMHDSVTQSLYSLTLLAEAGQRMINARNLAQISTNQARLSEVAQQALQEMRLMVYKLRPLALESEGLVGALEHRLEAVERRAGVDARLVVEKACDLSPNVEEELYKITQEALNNALKHAGASAVTVTIRAKGGSTVLEVQDNGRGFAPGEVRGKGGLGLVGMQERAEKIGGVLTILSTPGKGTTINVVVD